MNICGERVKGSVLCGERLPQRFSLIERENLAGAGKSKEKGFKFAIGLNEVGLNYKWSRNAWSGVKLKPSIGLDDGNPKIDFGKCDITLYRKRF